MQRLPALTKTTTGKLVHDWKDLNPDLDLPIVHLDIPEPVTETTAASFGFSWADKWLHGKRSLDDQHDDPVHDAPHKANPFPGGDLDPWADGMWFKDAPERKRDLFGGIDPGLSNTLDSTPQRSKGPSKGWFFEDTPRHKRGETWTQVVDDIIQPSEASDDPTSDLSHPRPREGWILASAPYKRDEASDEHVLE